MAKRFTDTDKWKKQWFRKLGSKLRDVRQFILDDCDLAGVWDVDLDRVGYHVGSEVTLADVFSAFGSEVVHYDDGKKLFVPDFIDFQYGSLVESCNAHKAVIRRLRNQGLEQFIGRVPRRVPGRDQDKDKDKDLDKDKDKDTDAEVFSGELTREAHLARIRELQAIGLGGRTIPQVLAGVSA